MRFPFYVDVGRAVFAVALAVLLYFVALSETNPADQRDLDTPVPVQPVNAPSGLVITTPPPPVRLRVTAPQNVFGRLRVDSFTAQVDVSSAHAGDNDLKDLNLRATPPAVNVQVPITQQTQYKEVGVRPVIQGQPAPGYALQPFDVNPPAATLVGDPTGLEAASFIDTAPIDITGISSTVVRSIALQPPPRTLLLQDGQTVTVTIRVTTLNVNQTVRVPPSVVNLSGSVQLARPLDLVSVTISGPAPALQTLSLNPNDFKVVLDVSGKGPGRYDIDVRVQQIPQGLTLQDFSPKKIQVDLSPAPPTPAPTLPPTPLPAPAG